MRIFAARFRNNGSISSLKSKKLGEFIENIERENEVEKKQKKKDLVCKSNNSSFFELRN